MLTCIYFIQPEYYTSVAQINHELAGESMLCMSSHARRLPEANLVTVHCFVCNSACHVTWSSEL